MSWLDWFASRHMWLVHLPWAAALLLIIPALAAQWGGRNHRPWWTTCRYLGWMGLAAAVVTAGSGILAAWSRGLLALAVAAPAQPGTAHLAQVHGAAGAGCVLLGAACLRALYRKRQDYQGIGLWALVLALAWSGSACAAVYTGRRLASRNQANAWLPGDAPARVAQLPAGR